MRPVCRQKSDRWKSGWRKSRWKIKVATRSPPHMPGLCYRDFCLLSVSYSNHRTVVLILLKSKLGLRDPSSLAALSHAGLTLLLLLRCVKSCWARLGLHCCPKWVPMPAWNRRPHRPRPPQLVAGSVVAHCSPGSASGPFPRGQRGPALLLPQLLLASRGRRVLVEDLPRCCPIHRHFCLHFCSSAPFTITSHRLGTLNTLSWTITSYLLSVTCIQTFLCHLPLTSLKSLSFDFSFSLELELFRFYSPPYPAFWLSYFQSISSDLSAYLICKIWSITDKSPE